jgi:hypothetical protein
MSEKRKRQPEDASIEKSRKKAKRGFVVGPDHLPDGSYKRKSTTASKLISTLPDVLLTSPIAQKIKKALIERAQIRKEYSKLKRQGKISDDTEQLPVPASLEQRPISNETHRDKETEQQKALPHPDRQSLIQAKAQEGHDKEYMNQHSDRGRKRKPKSAPFQREYQEAQRRKAEAEERRRAREEAERQRQAKLEEREKFRRAMAKARQGGVNGQRKLGRESKVLLERVKKMVGGDS